MGSPSRHLYLAILLCFFFALSSKSQEREVLQFSAESEESQDADTTVEATVSSGESDSASASVESGTTEEATSSEEPSTTGTPVVAEPEDPNTSEGIGEGTMDEASSDKEEEQKNAGNPLAESEISTGADPPSAPPTEKIHYVGPLPGGDPTIEGGVSSGEPDPVGSSTEFEPADEGTSFEETSSVGMTTVSSSNDPDPTDTPEDVLSEGLPSDEDSSVGVTTGSSSTDPAPTDTGFPEDFDSDQDFVPISAGDPAADDSFLPPCTKEESIKFKFEKRDVFWKKKMETADECCQKCLELTDCRVWVHRAAKVKKNGKLRKAKCFFLTDDFYERSYNSYFTSGSFF